MVHAATLSSAFPLGSQWSPLQSFCCGVNFLFWECEVWAPDESSGAPRRPATSGLQRITTLCKRADEKDTLGTLRQRGKAALEQLQRVRSNWQMYSEAEQQSQVPLSHRYPSGCEHQANYQHWALYVSGQLPSSLMLYPIMLFSAGTNKECGTCPRSWHRWLCVPEMPK